MKKLIILLVTGIMLSVSSLAQDVVYLRTGTCGNYWGRNGNATALNNTFGAGNWTRMNFEGLNVAGLLASNVKFIFIDGSNCGTCEFNTFLNTYRTQLEDWVFNGGALFLNAAPNECFFWIPTPLQLITDVSLIWETNSNGYPIDANHPVFQGPKIPAYANPYTGNSLGHMYISGNETTGILKGGSNKLILAEKKFGTGIIMFGGLTLEFFDYWNPKPHVTNLYSNILQYMYDYEIKCPPPTLTCPSDITVNNDTGQCGAHVDFSAVVESDCNAALTYSHQPGSFFPAGTTTVTIETIDDNNLSSSCSFNITVNDNEAPTITAPEATTGTTNVDCTSTNVVLGTSTTDDNCSVASVTNDSPSAFPLGETTVTWTVTDGSGNTATATQLVTVTDDIEPTITAPEATMGTTNEACTSTNVVLGTPTTDDNCSVASVTNDAPSEFPLGETTVTWTVTDESGNTATDTQLVTVTDDVAPVALTQNITLELDENGQANITANQVDNGSTDNCGIASVVIDKTDFTCADLTGSSKAIEPNYIGMQTLATQSHGGGYNPNTKEFWYPQWANPLVYKYDENYDYIGTLISGQNQMMQLWMDTDSDDYYTANWGNRTVTRRNGSSTVWSYDLGTTAAAVTTDANYVYALRATSNHITVLEKTSGAFIKNISLPGNIISYGGLAYANEYIYIAGYTYGWSSINYSFRAIHKIDSNTGQYISSTNLITDAYNMAFDGETMWISNNGNSIYGYQIAEGNAYGIGSINEVTLTVTDNNENSSSATAIITVEDNIAPIVLTQNITVELDENGQATITADQIDNGSTDNCRIGTIVLDKTDFDCSNVGSNTVILTVTDNSGNSSSAEATVTVEDITPPSKPAELFTAEYYDGYNFSTYKYTDQVEAINFNWISSSPNPTVLGVDYFSIRYTNTITAPASGNYTFKTYSDDGVRLWVNNQLVVNNWTHHPPTWNSGSIYLTAGQAIPIKLEWFEYGGGALISLYWESTEAGIPSQLVTGNQSQPCLDVTINLDENGNASISASDLDPGYTDACGIADRTLSKSTFDCNDIGINTVTLTITDNNGNTSICEPTVTVIDEVAPEAIAQNITIQLNENGEASITADQIDNGSNDACGIETIVVDITDFNCDNVGENTVTLTVTDNNGNISTATAIITIEDNIAPSVIIQNITIQLNENGEANITAEQIDNGSFDNCGIETIVLDQTEFDCSNIGSNTVTLTVVDVNGNVSSAEATVTVEDNIIPIAIAQDITIELDDNGQANITAEQVDNGSTDNCGISSLSIQNGVSDYIINGGFDLNADGWTPIGNQIPGWIEWKSTGGNPGGYYILNDVGGSSGFDPAIEQIITGLNIGDTYIIKGDYRNQYTGVIGQVSFGIDIDGNEIAALASPGYTWSPFSITFTASSTSHTLRFRGEINGTDIDMAIDNIALLNAESPATVLSFGCSDVGDNTVTLSVTDNNGNVSTASATVTVADNIAPTVITKNAIVFLDNSGNGSITAEEINNGSFDACGLESVTVSPNSFTCDDYGLNTVSLTVTDIHGNVSTADAEVNVLYNSTLGVFNQADYINIGNSVYLGDGEYRLTPALNSQFGAVWYQNQIDLSNDFNMEFDIYLGNKNGADGMAFVLQPLNTAQGSSGGGLGYKGINPSIAVEFDTYRNALDPYQDHVALMKNGVVIHGSIYTLAGPYAVSELENGQYHSLKISWNAQTYNFRVTLDNNLIVNYSGNIVSDIFSGNPGVFWGFTAATGGLNNEHRVKIYDLDFVEDFSLNEAHIIPSECSDSQDGSIDINLQYNPCYTYLWSNGETTEDISELNAGEYTVTVYHPDGRTITETYTVEIGDDTPPEINTQNTVIQLNEEGEAVLNLESVLIGVTDNCGVLSTELSKTNFNCSDIGDNTVTIVSEDINGNISSATATVTVEDNIAPTAISQNITIQLDENGEANITAEQIDNGSTDNCGIESLSLDFTSFSCADIGVNAVELTVTDVNGNVSTATATVTVEDNVAPVAIAQDLIIELDDNGQANITADQVNDGSTDNCGIATYEFVSSPGYVCATKPEWQTLRISAPAGSVFTSIAFASYGKPTGTCGNYSYASCHASNSMSIVSQRLIGKNSASIYVTNSTFGDPCRGTPKKLTVQANYGPGSVATTIKSFNCSNVGPNNVTLRVTDVNGNISYSNVVITVEDKIAPTVISQNITIQLDENGEANITAEQIDNGSTDNCGIESLSLDLTSFGCADIGVNAVELTVTDVNGNSSTSSATVTVQDNVEPKAIAKDITIQLDDYGAASIIASDIDDGSKDACGIASLEVSPSSFSCSEVGENTVILTVTDNNGNASTVDATVTIEDNVEPEAIAKDITIQLDDYGAVSIIASDIDNGSNDACGIASLLLSQTTFGCSEVGSNTVTLTVTDNNGNISTVDATVTVEDNVAPEAIAQDITIQLDGSGAASISASDIDSGSNDACGIASLSVAPNSFTCSEVGPNTVILTVTDNNANVSTVEATVTVEDIIIPTVITQPATIYLDDNGAASITVDMIDNASFDNCEIASLALNNMNFSCDDVGENEVILTAVDINGNTNSETAIVIVVDEIPPTMATQNITIYLDNNGTASIEPADIDNGTFDNCAFTLDVAPYEFDCSNTGDNSVTLTATDASNNVSSLTAVVTVVDEVYPTLSCVYVQEHCANIIGSNEYQVAGTDFDLIDMWDNCEIVSVTNDFNNANTLAGAIFPTGITLVTWTVTDPSGNATSCSFDVIINPLPIATITPSDVSMCCNELTLTANPFTSENLYDWSNGESTQSIGLSIDDDLEGIYTVIVTDQNGCVSPYAASYDYIPENLASSYIILGFESALIGQNHLVKNGAVGSSYSDGKAHFLRYAEVEGNGAFVKAPKVIAHKTSILPEVIKEQATLALPEMRYNTTSKITKRVKISDGTSETRSGTNSNLTIGDNCNITLTGQVFGNIILGSGSSLTFTSEEIYIRNLQMNRANKGIPSYLVFETDAVVLVKEKVMLDSYCIVNPDHFKVIFYIGEEYDGHHGQLQVKSEGAEFNACAYVPRGEIHVQENPKSVDIGYMNGQFFAEKIIGNGKNVIWNWTGSGASTNNNEINKTLPALDTQTLTIYPSPNDGSFMLFVESDIEDNFKIRIFNQLGARVYEIDQFEIRTGNTKRYISIQDIVPGVYTVELINDETRLIQKMVVTN